MNRTACVPCLDLLAAVHLESQPPTSTPSQRSSPPYTTSPIPTPEGGIPAAREVSSFWKSSKEKLLLAPALHWTTVLLLNHDLLHKKTQVTPRPVCPVRWPQLFPASYKKQAWWSEVTVREARMPGPLSFPRNHLRVLRSPCNALSRLTINVGEKSLPGSRLFVLLWDGLAFYIHAYFFSETLPFSLNPVWNKGRAGSSKAL